MPTKSELRARYVTDFHGYEGAVIGGVVRVTCIEDVRAAIVAARSRGQQICVRGSRASGSHTFATGALVLDMTGLNEIVSFDPVGRSVLVQAGATWLDILRVADPHQLSVACCQSSPSFTVGGSLSSNIHGRDVRFPVVDSTVQWIRYVDANGQVRESRPGDRMFSCIMGGFGLFGVIVEACLSLVPNEMLRVTTHSCEVSALGRTLMPLLRQPSTAMLHTQYSLARDATSVFYKVYRRVAAAPAVSADLQPLDVQRYVYDPNRHARCWSATRLKHLFESYVLAASRRLPRASRWGRHVLGSVQDVGYQEDLAATRNNSFSCRYALDHEHQGFTELFVPIHRLEGLVASVWSLFSSHRSATLLYLNSRYVGRRNRALLSYIRDDQAEWMTLVVYYQLEGKALVADLHRRMIDLALSHEGSYYLTYHVFATRRQLTTAYASFPEFCRLKLLSDPGNLFTSLWWQHYQSVEE